MPAGAIERIESLLRTRGDLAELGYTGRGVERALSAEQMTRVRRGWYIRTSRWRALRPEDRHVAHVVAVVRDMKTSSAVVSHVSAAAAWGLPLYGVAPRQVHFTLTGAARASDSGDVRRHHDLLHEDDVVEIDGVRVTSLARTIFDVARMLPREAAIAAADAALRRDAWSPASREYDASRAQAWRTDLEDRLAHASGARGVRQARWAARFADGRAELPGESVSRLQLARLGFAVPDLQVKIPAPRGHYWVDFGLGDVPAWGEFDGVGKYTDPVQLAGRAPHEVVLEEKRREDWIRGTTGLPLVRWEMAHIVSAAVLGRRLAAFGIRPPR